MNLQQLPFRLGTSSYIIPDNILPNARYLEGKVQDVELVLFEVDDGPNNLPDAATLAELKQLELSYTVHLPLDLRLGADGSEQHVSLVKAQRVIECTRELEPWAYVLHLDGREVKEAMGGADWLRWQDQAVRALELAAGWAGSAQRLAVENLEGYPLDFWEGVFEHSPAGRCVDIGHLWRDGHDPIPALERALPRTRVMHIHGIQGRDHQSLVHVERNELARILGWLLRKRYRGVLTMEIFSEDDFHSSMDALQKALGVLGEINE